MSFTIAIIGRPNVGKSTLFNRLVGQKLALVDDEPGVTRDRREGAGRLGDLEFTVIDTAGLDEGAKGSLTARMQEQTEAAIKLADALMFVIDARAGLTPNDRAFADLARRANKPVVLIANKCEGKQGETGAIEAYALGLSLPRRAKRLTATMSLKQTRNWRTVRSAWPWSAVPMRASPRLSIACLARNGC